MRIPDRLRQEFGGEPFLLRDALGLGASEGQLRSSRFVVPHHGIRALEPVNDSLYGRALSLLPKLREGDRFSHATALALLGCPIYIARDAPVDVEAQPGFTPLRRRGVRGHRAASASPPFLLSVPETDRLVPIVPPQRALFQGSVTLPFPELVVALDALIRDADTFFDPMARVRVEDLTALFRETAGCRGAVRFRAAVGLARIGAESRMETLTRLVGERAGVTDLVLQLEVKDRQGKAIGRFDLADEESRALFDYDGEQHRRNRRQYLRDLERMDRARDAGWRPLRFHHEDVLERVQQTGARMVAAIGRKPRPVSAQLQRLLDERVCDSAISALPRPAAVL